MTERRKIRYDNPIIKAGTPIGVLELEMPDDNELDTMTTDELLSLRKELRYVLNFAKGDIDKLTYIIEERVK